MSQTQSAGRPVALAIFLIVSGAVGLYASWELTLAKFDTLIHPDSSLSCDFSLIVQCGKNLESWQGSVFGFPNPMIGLVGFVAPIAVGVGILAMAQFTKWFWMLFNVGLAGAMAFVCWLIYQSIFILGTLCPWCMVVWSATIPLFLVVTLYNFTVGNWPVGRRLRAGFSAVYGWVPYLTLASYLAVAVIAQLRLDILSYLQ